MGSRPGSALRQGGPGSTPRPPRSRRSPGLCHEEEPLDHGVEAAALEGYLDGLDAAAASPRPVARWLGRRPGPPHPNTCGRRAVCSPAGHGRVPFGGRPWRTRRPPPKGRTPCQQSAASPPWPAGRRLVRDYLFWWTHRTCLPQSAAGSRLAARNSSSKRTPVSSSASALQVIAGPIYPSAPSSGSPAACSDRRPSSPTS